MVRRNEEENKNGAAAAAAAAEYYSTRCLPFPSLTVWKCGQVGGLRKFLLPVCFQSATRQGRVFLLPWCILHCRSPKTTLGPHPCHVVQCY
jgi:hypothetical protein